MKAIEQLMDEFSSESKDVLLLLRETAGMVKYYQRMLERFELDALTGLPGNVKFGDTIKFVKEKASSVGVIFFDVNDLKHYNDNIGHDAGDLLLQKAAESIHLICKPDVQGFRIGGDEFVVIMINCKESDIDAVLSQWRENLNELNSRNDGIHCSIAVGAAFGEGEYVFGDVLKQADERMYADKRRIKEAKSDE